MHRKNGFILAAMLLCWSVMTTAQNNFRFSHVNTKGHVVKALETDVNGIVWLGTTSGLLSLAQLQSTYPSAYQRPFNNANMSIKAMSGDSKGGLWIKTLYNDVFYYDPQHNEFVEDTAQKLSQRGIQVEREFTTIADHEGNTWIWKNNRLYWDQEQWAEPVVIEVGKDESFRGVRLTANFLVAITQNHLYMISVKERRITYKVALPSGYKFRDHLFADRSGRLWIWAENKVWTWGGDPATTWAETVQVSSDVTGIVQDSEGRYWVATQWDGIFICTAEGQVSAHLHHVTGDAYGLQSNLIEMVHYDERYQIVLVAYTKGGMSMYTSSDHYLPRKINGQNHEGEQSDVMTFAPARGSRGMWIGLEDRGVFLHTPQGDRNVLSSGSAIALHSDDDGSLWAGVYRRGLQHIMPDGHVQHYFEGSSPFAIAVDGQGHLFAALLGKGVWQLDVATGQTADTRIAANYVFGLVYHQRKLYAASSEGLWVMGDGRGWTKIADGHFRYLAIDHNDNIWLLGDEGSEGLTLLTPDGKTVDLPADLRTAPLKGICQDKDGNIWAVSPTELLMLRYEAKAKEPLQRYGYKINAADGQMFYNFHEAIVDDEGILWLGTTDGFQEIDIRKLQSLSKNTVADYQLIVGALYINDNVISPGQDFNGRVLLQQDVTYTHNLDLNHDENNIVLEFTFYQGSGAPTQFLYYQLKGQSDAWHQIKNNTIFLSNLRPGHYQLYTKTQYSEPKLLMTIHVAPPFWLSVWAFILYAVVLAAAVYGLWHYYSNRKRYQQQLREMQLQQEQQDQMNEMKLRFFTNISHDLRTPLTLIIGPIEELMKSVEPKYQSSLRMIQRNAEHLLSLVNQVLDFRRLENGREKLLPSYGDIVSLVGDACDAFTQKAEKTNIQFTYAPSVERVETVFDRDKTTKIMMNLLSNAFKFTDDGGKISVRLDISDGKIIISVADTGVGITDDDKQRIFERFYQSDDVNRASMGSGVGLHIVREYVQLQGGEITVSDNEEAGKGSIFRFTLPLKQEEEFEQEETDVEGQEQQPGMPVLLLVDDNTDLLGYMSNSLADTYQILKATTGVEALNLLRENDVDIIVTDVMMPEMDGMELCQRVKDDIETSHIPVVMLTAKTLTSDELRGLEAGADDYVTKPFSMDVLRQRLLKLIERSQNQHERFAREINIEPSEITVTSLDEQFIARAISIVETHMAEPDFSVEQLSDEMGVHRAQLYKKLQHLTGKSPQQFIRLLRLKRGKQLLEQSGLYVSEVAYQVGFNSPRIFSKYFKEEFGMTPKDYTNNTSS